MFLVLAKRVYISSAPSSAKLLSIKLPSVKLRSATIRGDVATRGLSVVAGVDNPVAGERGTILCGEWSKNSMDNDLSGARLLTAIVETILYKIK